MRKRRTLCRGRACKKPHYWVERTRVPPRDGRTTVHALTVALRVWKRAYLAIPAVQRALGQWVCWGSWRGHSWDAEAWRASQRATCRTAAELGGKIDVNVQRVCAVTKFAQTVGALCQTKKLPGSSLDPNERQRSRAEGARVVHWRRETKG